MVCINTIARDHDALEDCTLRDQFEELVPLEANQQRMPYGEVEEYSM